MFQEEREQSQFGFRSTRDNTMKTKLTRSFSASILIAGIMTLGLGQVTGQTDEEAIAVARSVIKADRQAVVAETLQFTATESQGFWPLYQQYRAEMDKVADRLVKLVQEYAQDYPDVPEARAKQMLKDLTDLEEKQATLQFEDGSTRTFPVRSDVDLKQRKIGERVAFRVTEMVAISVEKP